MKVVRKLFLGLSSFMLSAGIFANPVVDNIAAGQVTIQQTPNSTVIQQSTQQGIINWQSFNIGAQESTHFQQPAGGTTLNRINPAQGVSQIYGRLTATGQIILVNPAGIFFGPSAFVNVGGLIASTANISDQDFLNNYYHFANVPGFNGAIVNQGQIIAANNGLVALIGGAVSNSGMIQANMGHVVLASGDAFTMSFAGNDLVSFAVDEGVHQRAQDQNGNEMKDGVKNTGSIIANGGHVLISAKDASGVLDNVISMQGVAQTHAVYENNGSIILFGDPDGGVVSLNGVLDGSGFENGVQGGNVIVTGHNIIVGNNAVINVSGDAGGGNVKIGGDIQGGGSLATSNAVVMESGAKILADAITNGNGGNIVMWSDYYTNANGTISAQGGSQSGNGGYVETSSKHILQIGDLDVDTSASHGNSGEWLLDPGDLTITGADSNVTGSSPFEPTAAGATLNVATLTSALANGNVIVQTNNDGFAGSGNITVSSPITWTSAYKLTLNAFNNIIINAGISGINGSLDLSAANAAQSITTGASGSVDVANFNLVQGSWYQVGTLPAFTVRNSFALNSDARLDLANTQFLRAAGGDGSTGSPYQLTDIYGVQGINSNGLLAYSYILNNDIDATGTRSWNNGTGFHPIGFFNAFDSSREFSGYFNGNNHTINGLYINRSAYESGSVGEMGTALFAVTYTNTASPSIYNLGLTNANITSTNNRAGGLIAFVDYNTPGGFYSPVIIDNSYVTGSVTSGSSFAGGLIGYMGWGSIQNSYNAATVTTTNAFGGGLVGFLSFGSMINDTYNIGTITSNGNGYGGGLVGFAGNSTIISNSYNSGLVTGGTGGSGGLIGNNTNGASVANNFFDTTTSGQTTGTGNGSSSGITGVNSSTMMTATTFSGAGWSIASSGFTGSTPPSATWLILDGQTRPLLKSEWNTSINNAHQLQLMSTALGANYSIAKNIDLSSALTNTADVWNTNYNTPTGSGFVPVGTSANKYSGNFNGNNYTIDNLYIRRANLELGLFGATADSSTISNIGLTNVNITQLAGSNVAVGGLAGRVGGNVTNAYTTGNISSLSDNTGGLIGYVNSGGTTVTVSNSYSSANVTSTGWYAGGLIGHADTYSETLRSYANGNVTGDTFVGGLIGFNNGYPTQDVYATGNVTGNAVVGGLIGKQYSSLYRGYSSGLVNNGVSGASVGGFIGETSFLIGIGWFVGDSFWDSVTSGQTKGVGSYDDGTNGPGAVTLYAGCFAAGGTCGTQTISNATLTGSITPKDLSVAATYNTGGPNWSIANSGFTGSTPPAATWLILDGSTRPMLRAEWSTSIKNAHQMQLINTALAGNYTMASNIDASASGNNAAEVWGTNLTNGKGFKPIGNFSNPFNGTFNGQDHTLSNLYIKQTSGSIDTGLFGDVISGTVNNLTLLSPTVIGYNGATGALAGVVGTPGTPGFVSNITVKNGIVSSQYGDTGGVIGDIWSSTASGLHNINTSVDNLSGLLGGVAGFVVSSTITNSSNSGTIGHLDINDYLSDVGGIAGLATMYSNYGSPYITNSYNTGNIYGTNEVGGIVGRINGNGSYPGFITDSFNTGTVTYNQAGGSIGGIIGLAQTVDINRVYNSGTIINVLDAYSATGNGWQGGIIGNTQSGGSLTNSYNVGTITLVPGTTGTYIGGLIGTTFGSYTLSNSYNSGSVINNGSVTNTGALIGAATGGGTLTVSNSYYDSATSGATGSYGTSKTTSELMQAATFSSWNITNTPSTGSNTPNNTWFIFEGDTRPLLMMENTSTISNAHQLQMMGAALGGQYTLANNIDLTASMTNLSDVWNTDTNAPTGSGFAPIGNHTDNFTGSFNGNHFTINALYILRPTTDYVGLFSQLSSTATVQDVGLTNINVRGQNYVGGVTGNNLGRIDHVYVTGNGQQPQFVGGDQQLSNIQARGVSNVGGIAGNNENIISNSYNTANVVGQNLIGVNSGGLVGRNNGLIINSYNNGVVNGFATTNVGGIAGLNDTSGQIINTFNTGSFTTGYFSSSLGSLVGNNYGLISNSYNTGNLFAESANSNLGGLAGVNQSTGTISNSYNLGGVVANSTSTYVGGITGYNAGTVTNTYMTGYLSGNAATTGGVVGTNTGTVTNSYWNTETTGFVVSDGGTGLTTAQMMNAANFTGWDFANVWNIVTDHTYPYLRAFYSTPVRAIAGTSSAAPLTTFTMSINGVGIQSAYTGTNGYFYQLLGLNNISGINTNLADGSTLLVYQNGTPSSGNVLTLLPTANGSLSGNTQLTLTANTVTIGNNGQSISMSNAALAAAKGSLSDSGIIYSVDGSNNLSLSNGYSFTTTANTAYTLDGNISTINGNITMHGAITLSTATPSLTASNSGDINIDSNINGNGNTLTINTDGSNSSITGNISNITSFSKSGSGKLVLSGSNSYDGTTSINDGILSVNSIASVGGGNSALGAPSSVGNGTINIGATGTLQYTGTGHSSDRVINLTGSGATIDASGSGALLLSGNITGGNNNLVLTGSGAGTESGAITTTNSTLTKSGSGIWTLSSTGNTYGNGASTIINGGTLAISSDSNLGVVPGSPDVDNIVISNGGILQTSGSFEINSNRGILIGSNGGKIQTTTNSDTLTYNGLLDSQFYLDNTASLTLDGPGNMVFGGNIGQINYLGALTVTNNLASFTLNSPNVSTYTTQTYNIPIIFGNTVNQTILSGDTLTLSGATWTGTNTISLQTNSGMLLNGPISGINGSLVLHEENANINIANSDTATINVRNFNLSNGLWYQVLGQGPLSSSIVLPTFNVSNNFQINSGSMPATNPTQFIRATSGDGSFATPYVLVDVYGLQGIGSDATTITQNFKLGSNIDAAAVQNWTNSGGTGFNPIGNSTNPFTGTLDGQNFAINNLYISQNNATNVGLFGYTFGGALSNVGVTNANINITGTGTNIGILAGNASTPLSNVYTSGSITVTGTATAVGGIAGLLPGGGVNITGSHNAANITVGNNSSSIGGIGGGTNWGSASDSYNTGNIIVNGDGSVIGGLIGGSNLVLNDVYNTGNIFITGNGNSIGGLTATTIGGFAYTNTYNTGNITIGGTGTSIGGLIGGSNWTNNINQGTLNSYTSGTIFITGAGTYVGGLIGGSNSNSVNSYSVSNIYVGANSSNIGGLYGIFSLGNNVDKNYSSGRIIAGNNSTNVGGFIGNLGGSNTITNSFYDTDSSQQVNALGAGTSAGITGGCFSGTCTNGGTVNLSDINTYTNAGWDITSTPTNTGSAPGNAWFIFDGSTRPILTMEQQTSVSNAHQLQMMGSALGGTYTLAKDIDLANALTNTSEVWGTNYNTSTGAGFVPIGNAATNFTGTLDGQNHVVNHLYIYRPTTEYIGLIGVTFNTLQNIGLTNVNITGQYIIGALAAAGNGNVSNVYVNGGTVTGSPTGGDAYWGGTMIGGLFGLSSGLHNNVYSNVTVSGHSYIGGAYGYTNALITNSYSTSNVIGNDGAVVVGGFAGNTVANLTGLINVYSSGTVSSGKNSVYVGGLVGLIGNGDGGVTNSYSTSSVSVDTGSSYVGGLAGAAGWDITNSYSSGAVNAPGSTNVGGFVGLNNATITNSFWDTQTSGQATGVASGNTSGVTGLTTADTMSYTTISGIFGTSTGANAGGITSTASTSATAPDYTWFIFDGGTRPILMMENTPTIKNAHQLQMMGAAVGGSYTQTSNIDLTSAMTNTSDVWGTNSLTATGQGFVPVGQYTGVPGGQYFTGTYDGNGYAINNLYINYQSPNLYFVGLFGAINTNALITNAQLNNVNITSSSSTANNASTGGLVGLAVGTSKISTSYTSGSVTGLNIVGGLLGATYFNNLNVADVEISNSYSTADVTTAMAMAGSTTPSAGGLIGELNSGPIGTLRITNSYSSGKVIGYRTGGLIGDHNSLGDIITNSFWDVTSSGLATSGGGIGVTTSAMMQAATFSGNGWNITNNPLASSGKTWFIFDGYTRPMLMTENSSSISNTHQLQMMGATLSGNYSLANNIDFNTVTSTSDVWNTAFNAYDVANPYGFPSARGFSPVGNNSTKFTGSFNGQNYTITHLVINTPTISYVGLFGATSNTASLSNVVIYNPVIYGGGYVGAIVGNNGGTVSNSHATSNTGGATWIGGELQANNEDIRSTWPTGSGTVVGGIAGQNDGFITDSYTHLNMMGGYMGGLSGINNGTITRSYSSNSMGDGGYSVMGGLVGLNSSTGSITDSFFTGNIYSGYYYSYYGGIAGYNAGTIDKTYNLGGVYPGFLNGAVGGFVGYNAPTGVVSNSYNGGYMGFGQAQDGPLGGFVGVNDGLISNTYNYGLAYYPPSPAGTNNNGFAGINNGTINNSFWDIGTTGYTRGYATNNGTINGLYAGCFGNTSCNGANSITNATNASGTPFDLTLASTYANWNTASIWNNVDGQSYPYLRDFYSLTPRAISGIHPTGSRFNSVSIAVNGSVMDSTYSFSNGAFYLLEGYNNISKIDHRIADLAGIVAFSTSGIYANYVTYAPQNGASMSVSSPIVLAANTITASTSETNPFLVTPLTNAQIAGAVNGLSSPYLLFSNSGNDLTITNGYNLTIPTSTPYVLNGNITLTNGTLTINSPLTLNTASVTLTTNSSGDIALNNTVTGGGNALTINTAGGFSSANGVMSNLSSFTKAGTGTLTLTAANNYSTNTTVAAGILRAANDSALGTSTVTVNSGATLQIQNGFTVNNTLSLTGYGAAGSNGALDATGNGPANVAGVITLADDTAIGAAVDSTLNINSTIDGITNGGQSLFLSGAGHVTLNAAVGNGANTALNTLTSNIATSLNAGNVKSVGSQAYNNTVTVAGNTTVTSTANDIAFNTINGTAGLTISANTSASLAGSIDIGSLTITAPSGITMIGSDITTTGDQTYNNAITGTPGTKTFTTTAGGSINLDSYTGSGVGGDVYFTAGGGPTAVINVNNGVAFAYNTVFNSVGGTNINTSNTIYGNNQLIFHGPVYLNSNANFVTRHAGGMYIYDDIFGPGGLTEIVAFNNGFSDQSTFGGAVGSALLPLAYLTVSENTSGGYIRFLDSVHVTGAISLGSNANWGSGEIQFDGAPGSVVNADSLSATGGSGIRINGYTITTNGDQSYSINGQGGIIGSGNLFINGGDVTLTSTTGSISLIGGSAGTGTIEGDGVSPRSLIINSATGANIYMDIGDVNPLNNLTISGLTTLTSAASSITTLGNQSYNNGMIVGVNASIKSTNGGDIGFGTSLIAGTVNGSASLTINNAVAAPGNVTFWSPVGNVTPLTSLSAYGSSINLRGGSVTTSGAQNYHNLVTLFADTTLTSTANSISLLNNITSDAPGTPRSLTLTAADPVVITGNIGSPNLLNAFTITNDSSIGANIQTVGAQTYSGAMTLTTDSSLSSDTDDITISSTIDGGNNLLTINNAGNNSLVSGAMTNLSLVKDGAGKLTLTGNNTYTGGTTITNGILQIGNGGATGSIIGAITDDGALIFNTSNNFTVAGAVSGSGSVTQAGSGTTIFSANNSYLGTTTISGGTLQIGNGSTTGSLGTGNVVNDAALIFNRSNTYILSNAISGAGSLTQNGGGTVSITGNNTFTGATAINSGIVSIDSANALGNGTNNTSAISIASGGQLLLNDFTLAAASPTITINGIGGNGKGAIYHNSGTSISLNNPVLLASNSTIGNAVGSLNLTNTIDNNGSTLTLDASVDINVSGTITGSGGVTITDAPFNPVVTFSNANSYTGATNINAGILKLAHADALGTALTHTSAVNISSGGELQINGVAVTAAPTLTLNGNGVFGTDGALYAASGNSSFDGAIILAGNSTIKVESGATLNLSNTSNITGSGFNTTLNGGGSGTLAGVIATGTGTLTKADSGTWTLTGDNTNTGITTISGGTLQFGNGGTSGSPGSGNITNNGALIIDRSNAVSYSGVISGTGTVTKSGTGTLTLSGANTFTGATSVSNGRLNLASLTALGCNSVGTCGYSTQSSGVTVNSGATLEFGSALGAGTFGNINPITINGSGVGGVGALYYTTGSSVIVNNNINLASDSTIGQSTSPAIFQLWGNITNTSAGNTPATLTFNGNANIQTWGTIADGAGSRTLSLTANTTGSVNLESANTYTGATVVSGGILGVSNANALGSGSTMSSSTTVASGGTLAFTTFTGSLGNTNLITLNGTGASGAGAIKNYPGNARTISNNINIASDSTINNSGNNSITFSGNITNSATNTPATVTFDGTGDNVSSGIISNGAGTSTLAVTKINTGTLTLSGTNTYTGATSINGGTLSVASSANLGSASNSISFNGGTLQNTGAFSTSRNISLAGAGTVNTGADLILSGAISGSGALTKSGSNILSLGGSNTYTGATTVGAGTLKITNASALGDGINNSSSINVVSGATLEINTILPNNINATITLNGTGVGGAGALTMTSSSFLLFNNINIASNATIGNYTTGIGNISPLMGGITNSAVNTPLTVTFTGNSGVYTQMNNGFGGGGIISNGAGTSTLGITAAFSGNGALMLDTASTFTGPVNVTSGFLTLNNANAIGTSGASSIAVNSGGTLSLGTFNGQLQNTSPITINGTGVSGIFGAIFNSGTNTLANNISVADNSTISNSNTLTISGGISNNNASAKTLTMNTLNASATTISGVIADGTSALSITKSGSGASPNAGILTLSGNNTYTGSTSINAGTLSVAASANLGSASNTLIFNGGTLLNTGAFTTSRNVSLAGAGTVNTSADLTLSGVVYGTGSLTKSGTSTLTLSGFNDYTGATNISAGMLNITNVYALGDYTANQSSSINVANNALLNLGFANGTTNTLLNTNTITLNGGTGSLSMDGFNTTNTLTNAIVLADNSSIVSGPLGVNTNSNLILNGNISDGGNGYSLTQAGVATVTLGGTNTYSGGTVIGSGTAAVLNVTNAQGLGTTGSISLYGDASSGSDLRLNLSTGGHTLLNNSTITLNNSRIISQASGVTDTLNNPFVITGSVSTRTGFLVANANAGLNLTGSITNGSTNTPLSTTFNSIGNITSSGNITDGAGTSTLAITKNGGGTLALSGNSSFTGGTTLNAGTLAAGNNNALGTNTLIMNSGTTLSESVSGISLANVISLNGNAAIDNNSGTFALNGTIDGANALSLSGSGTTILGGAIGGGTKLASVNADANLIVNGGGIATTGNQLFNGNVDLGNAAIFASDGTGSQSITFGGTVNAGTNDLTLSGTNSGSYQFTLNGLNSTAANITVTAAPAATNNSLLLNTGGTQNFTITGTDVGNIGGIATVTSAFNFNNIQNLTGGSGNDTFTLAGGSITGSINGGAGNNTLVGGSAINTWNITASNSGTLTGIGLGFSNIGNLTGNGAVDKFHIADGASISGTISGGDSTTINDVYLDNYTGVLYLRLILTGNVIENGAIYDSSGINRIANLSQIQRSYGNTLGYITLPSGNIKLTYYGGSSNLSGEIADPFYFVGWIIGNPPPPSLSSSLPASIPNVFNPSIAAIVNQPQTNAGNNNNYNSNNNSSSGNNDYISPINYDAFYDSTVINNTYIEPVLKETTVKFGPTCFKAMN